jgi:hypothetical protein
MLLRSHQFDEDVKYAKDEVYPFTHAANLTVGEELADAVIMDTFAQLDCQVDIKGKRRVVTLKGFLTTLCPYMHPPFASYCLREVGVSSLNTKLIRASTQQSVTTSAKSSSSLATSRKAEL